jgi:hypothetical protein
VENSLGKLQSEHNKGIREVDSKIAELKASIPPRILSMKLCDVFKLKDFTDVCIEEKMTNLNVTVKETVQKADEGKFGFWFHFHRLHFRHFLICRFLHLSLPFRSINCH